MGLKTSFKKIKKMGRKAVQYGLMPLLFATACTTGYSQTLPANDRTPPQDTVENTANDVMPQTMIGDEEYKIQKLVVLFNNSTGEYKVEQMSGFAQQHQTVDGNPAMMRVGFKSQYGGGLNVGGNTTTVRWKKIDPVDNPQDNRTGQNLVDVEVELAPYKNMGVAQNHSVFTVQPNGDPDDAFAESDPFEVEKMTFKGRVVMVITDENGNPLQNAKNAMNQMVSNSNGRRPSGLAVKIAFLGNGHGQFGYSRSQIRGDGNERTNRFNVPIYLTGPQEP